MSRRAALLSLALRTTTRPVCAVWTRLPGLPWPYGLVDLAGLVPRVLPGTTFETRRLADVRAQVVTTPAGDPDRVILYFPGGAFLIGGWFLHRGLLSRIAEQTRSAIVAVEYRKLPRHPVTTAVEDCVDAYRDLLRRGIRPDQIVLMGDSAGGYLTFAVAAALRRAGLPTAAGLVALSPLCELSDVAVEVGEFDRGCAAFPPGAVPQLWRQIARAAGGSVIEDLDVADLPPVTVQVARGECLYPQVKRLADRINAHGGSCELLAWDLDIHVFQAASWLPETVEALDALTGFVDDVHALRQQESAG